jgi:hypothetical protein
MPDRIFLRCAHLLLHAALLLPLIASAQSDRWYRVEMLVFSYPAGGASEQWDATPDLAYPGSSRFLIYPGEERAAELDAGQPVPSPSVVPPTVLTPPAPVEPQSTAFAILPQSQREFAGKAAYMQRSGRYRVLFHEAWLQPMRGQASAVPIVLDRSGDGGPWPALQGTIKLYLSRYFYLETNLWLNTQGEYLPGAWRMPPPPLAPTSIKIEEPRQTQPGPGVLAQAIPPAPQTGVADTQFSAPESQALGPAYPFRHAVLLKQTRRMRSREVNYIDHPVFGVVVKVTPLEEAATETTAEGALPGV